MDAQVEASLEKTVDRVVEKPVNICVGASDGCFSMAGGIVGVEADGSLLVGLIVGV